MDIFKKWISYQNVHVSTLSIYMIHEASMSGFEQKCFFVRDKHSGISRKAYTHS